MKAPQSATIDFRREDTSLRGGNQVYKQTQKKTLFKLGSNYEVTENGLMIKNTSQDDEGTYVCRVRVAKTGQLEEKIIKLEV